jgi:hypothetical protein
MQIKTQQETPVQFHEIKSGEVFAIIGSSSALYMKIKESCSYKKIAVNLYTGEVFQFREQELVVRVSGEFVPDNLK